MSLLGLLKNSVKKSVVRTVSNVIGSQVSRKVRKATKGRVSVSLRIR
jgi:hypothetical protein